MGAFFAWLRDNTWVAEWVIAVSAFGALIKYLEVRKRIRTKTQVRARKLPIEINKTIQSLKENKSKEENILDGVDKLINEVAGISEIPESVSYLRELISAQLFWVGRGDSAWVKDLDNYPDEPNKEWVSGTMNGVLDVVKDYVLSNADRGYIQKDFWIAVTLPYLDDDFAGEMSLEPSRDDYERAQKRWVEKSQRENARIKALVDYKVIAEFALMRSLTANFSNPRLNELPRSGKFMLSTRHVQSMLLEALQKQLESLCKGKKKRGSTMLPFTNN